MNKRNAKWGVVTTCFISKITERISIKFSITELRECIQKFPDWPPGARTAYGTALCH